MPKILRKLKEEQKARGCQKVHGGQKDDAEDSEDMEGAGDANFWGPFAFVKEKNRRIRKKKGVVF